VLPVRPKSENLPAMHRLFWIALLAAACGAEPLHEAAPRPGPPERTSDLRSPDAFGTIRDRTERSQALFVEASRVMLHPRCVNCHPADDSPRQRDGGEMHDPPVVRGEDDRGVPAMRCDSCHQDANIELARVPGAPGWHLAPKAMAWAGITPARLCEQLKDPARNGGRTLAKVVDHAAHDRLVGWAWAPGHGRTRVPGTQERFAALVAAWVDTGAACPPERREEARR
jgi:hypothetical protein